MRSRACHARALLRLAASHAPAASASAALPAAAAAARSSAAASLHVSSSKLGSAGAMMHSVAAVHSSPSSQRRAYVAPADSAGRRRAVRPSPSRRRSSSAAVACAPESPMQPGAAASRSRGAASAKGSETLVLAAPPPSSLNDVALQSFFSVHRPLLEHSVVAPTADGKGSSGSSPRVKEIVADMMSNSSKAKGAIIEIAVPYDQTWPRALRNIEPQQFSKLLERLSSPMRPSSTVGLSAHVYREAARIAADERARADRADAVSAAIERGEDPAIAESLGSEADLVVLGEPDGPHKDWAPGVATYLAEHTRAFEAPAPPTVGAVPHSGASMRVLSSEEQEMEAIAARLTTLFLDSMRGSASSGSSQALHQDDDEPNLLLSHAMVQASLPRALSWDSVLAKMSEAAGTEPAGPAVNLSALNADLLPRPVSVDMDSVRRKRKKKMRKHK
jgi:hypothetical protein